MSTYLRSIDFMLMMLLVISEIVYIFLLILNLFYTVGLEDDYITPAYYVYLIFNTISIIIQLCNLWIVIVCGFHALYFKIVNKLIWYIISTLILTVFLWIKVIVYFGIGLYNDETSWPEVIIQLNLLVLYIDLGKTVCYYASAVITFVERKALMNAATHAPLSIIDETLTEELYRNIILQSKNPGDEALINEYKKMTSSSHLKKNSNSGATLNDSISSIGSKNKQNHLNNIQSHFLCRKKSEQKSDDLTYCRI